MQPRHYGTNLNQPKRFSAPFDPAGYTYWDYIDAWTNVFWHQNNKFKHSWLIYFKNNTVYNFPNWFLQWWTYFGPIPQLFPEEVQQGFQQFNRLFNNQESRIPADLMYFSSFALSWIFSWQYSSKSKESLAQNLKEVLQLLQQEEEEESSKKDVGSSKDIDDQDDDPFYQNEDDFFGISLEDD
ncbi:hypothetical protein GYH30_025113 [Glycine max]|nr:hypothetical protein GYH30_025113 [Glycine max]